MGTRNYCPWCMSDSVVGDAHVCPVCGRDPQAYVSDSRVMPPFKRLGERYVLGRVLAEDDTVVCYIGRDEVLNRLVDVWEYRPYGWGHGAGFTVLADEASFEMAAQFERGRTAFLERFRGYAAVAGRDALPGIVDLFEEGGTAYAVSEHVEGQTLAAYVACRGGRLAFTELRSLLAPVIRSLVAMHEANLVHGMVSATTIAVTPMAVRLSPYRLQETDAAEAAPENRGGLTVAVRLPDDPAPVQSQELERTASARSDVEALCRTMLSALTGETTVGGTKMQAPSACGVDMPRDAEEVLMRGADAVAWPDVPTMRELMAVWYGDTTVSVTDDVSTVEPPGYTVAPRAGAVAASTAHGHTTGIAGRVEKHATLASGAESDKAPGGVRRLAWVALIAVAVIAVVAVVVCGMGASSTEGGSQASDRRDRLALGLYDTLCVTSDGTVDIRGYDFYGQFEARTWRHVKQAAVGGCHVLGVLDDGSVVAAGRDKEGQCDVGGRSNAKQVAAGVLHSVCLYSDGTVEAMGNNELGQCEVEDWEDVVSVAAGDSHTVGLLEDGTVVACGRADEGQLDVSDWEDVTQVACGGVHTVGLAADGTCLATGADDVGQCDVTSWSDVVSVACGYEHTVALLGDGTVVACGANDVGQCDVGDWAGVRAVYAGGRCTVAELDDGSLVGTGYACDDQLRPIDWATLGTSSAAEQWASLPILHAADSPVDCVAAEAYTARVTGSGDVEVVGKASWKADVAEWHDVTSLAEGEGFLAGLRTDGAVVVVGDAAGIADATSWDDVVAIFARGSRLVGLHSDGSVLIAGDEGAFGDATEWDDIVNVAMGKSHMVGLRSDGTVVACGSNKRAQCDVSEWADVVAVACGDAHTVGLRSDGTVVATGDDADGRLDVGKWEEIVGIDVGAAHTVGLRSDGTVVACGDNSQGQCDVDAWADVKVVMAKGDDTYAIKVGGVMLAKGDDRHHQLGIAGVSDVAVLYCGENHVVARQLLGEYVAAGDDSSGQCEVASWRN